MTQVTVTVDGNRREPVDVYDVLRDGELLTNMSDATVKERVATFFDLPSNALANHVVARVDDGNLQIIPKPEYG